MRPKIFLAQKNNHFAFQNIAIRYNMGYTNLLTHKLNDCCDFVKNCGFKNVILNCYGQ